ncbi:MAG: YvcK family protein [Anaerolineae bacterium]|nr:YvcK family protein [Anaerolineae bacterium]
MHIPTRLQSNLKWLFPGLGVKRWLLLMAAGVALLGFGVGTVLQRQPDPLPAVLQAVSLAFLPPWGRGLIFALLGGGLTLAGLAGLNRALLAPFTHGGGQVVEALYQHRQRERGPKIVAIGGGHGLATLLRGLKAHTRHITAIVTVADDGGSSGRLRRALGVLPPGDIRNCIAALADDEALITQLFQYRFPATTAETSLNGHSFGNLFITAMAEVTGSFEQAILESSRVLAVQGRVIPSTLQSVTLVGELRTAPDGVSQVAGESQITGAGGVIERVHLQPDVASAHPAAVRAILEADLVVAGPGSLYTSLLPNLLVREIAQAVAASHGLKVYVCNVATQRGETDAYDASDHVAALERHVGRGLFSTVVANDNFQHAAALPAGSEAVRLNPALDAAYTLYSADLVDPACPWRHDGDKLARVLVRLVEQRRNRETV